MNPQSIAFDKALEEMQQAGLKRTQARRAILELLISEAGPLSVEDIQKKLNDRGCDLVTISKNVTMMTTHGLLKRWDSPDRIQRFSMHDAGYLTYDVSCKKCGTKSELDRVLIKKLSDQLTKKGFQELEFKFDVKGLCPSCYKQRLFTKTSHKSV